MSNEEILEGNKLIAEFMGGKVIDEIFICKELTKSHNERCLHHYNISQAKYHSSLDWLIPVIEKIESIGFRWEIGMSLKNPYHYCKIWSIGTIEGISPINAIYSAAIEFIKWYNQNKNETN